MTPSAISPSSNANGWTRAALPPAIRLGALTFTVAALLLGPLPASGAATSTSDGWVYLRGGALPAPGESVVEVLAVGDVMTGRGLAGTPDLFAHVSDALQDADLTIGNLEGALSDAPVPADSVWLHLPLNTPDMLAEAGFDLLGLGNNHPRARRRWGGPGRDATPSARGWPRAGGDRARRRAGDRRPDVRVSGLERPRQAGPRRAVERRAPGPGHGGYRHRYGALGARVPAPSSPAPGGVGQQVA